MRISSQTPVPLTREFTSEGRLVAKVKVHAGDWASGSEHSFGFGSFSLRGHGKWLPETVRADRLVNLEVASEENVKRLGGAAGWGAVGALALGPVGLLAGVVMGGNKKDVTFIAEFDDGRKMLATTDSKAFTQMQAAIFARPTGAMGKTRQPQKLTAPNPVTDGAGWGADISGLSRSERDKLALELRAIYEGSDGFTTADLDHYESLIRDGKGVEAERLAADIQARAAQVRDENLQVTLNRLDEMLAGMTPSERTAHAASMRNLYEEAGTHMGVDFDRYEALLVAGHGAEALKVLDGPNTTSRIEGDIVALAEDYNLTMAEARRLAEIEGDPSRQDEWLEIVERGAARGL